MMIYRHILHFSRHALLWGGTAAVLLMALSWGGLQWIILHHVDQYRAQLMTVFQQETGLQIEVGALHSVGFRWLPTVVLDQVTIADPQGKPGLHLDRVEGRLSLLGLFQGRVDLQALLIDGPTLTLGRNTQGQFFLSGIPLPQPQSGPSPFLDWLLHQGTIHITHATLYWQDDTLPASLLKLDQGELLLRNRGRHHALALTFSPPQRLAAPVSLQADLYGSDLGQIRQWTGKVSAEAYQADLAALKQWVPALNQLQQAYGHLKLTATLEPGQHWGGQADLDLHHVQGRLDPALSPLHLEHVRGMIAARTLDSGVEVSTGQLTLETEDHSLLTPPLDLHLIAEDTGGLLSLNQLHLDHLAELLGALPVPESLRQQVVRADLKGNVSALEANWNGSLEKPENYQFKADFDHFQGRHASSTSAIQGFTGHLQADSEGGQLKGQGKDLLLGLAQVFAEPLWVRTFAADITWKNRHAQTRVQFNQLTFSNEDLAGQVGGELTLGPAGPGAAHLTGELERASPMAIWRYVPLTVPQSTRDWLKQAVIGGRGAQVRFEVQGDLQRFPFPQDRGGFFRVRAQIADAQLRYDPDWPVLTGVQCQLLVNGAALTVNATAAQSYGVQIRTAQARIEDLQADDSHLEIVGEVDAPLHESLNFIAHSPVAGYLSHGLDEFKGSGNGRLALAMQIPLSHAQATQVTGDYEFLNAELNGMALGIPPMTQLKGHLVFTDQRVNSQALSATILGGPANLQWFTSDDQGIHLLLQGTANAAELRKVYHHAVLNEVSGTAHWQGALLFSRQHTDLQLDSSLNFLGEPVSLQLTRGADGGLDLMLAGKTSPAAIQRRYPYGLAKLMDGPLDWNGHVRWHAGQTEAKLQGKGQVLQEPVLLQVVDSQGTLRADLTGHVAAGSLGRLIGPNWARRLQGQTAYRLHLEQLGHDAAVTLTSDLLGLAVNYPRPFEKTRRDALALQGRAWLHGSDLTVEAKLGEWMGGHVLYTLLPKGGIQARHGEIYLGERSSGTQSEGFSLTGMLRHADLDQWRTVLGEGNATADAGNADFGPLTRLNLVLEDVRLGGHVWGRHAVVATAQEGRWQAHVEGPEAAGDITWVPEGVGLLQGHLSKLFIPGEGQHSQQPDQAAIDLDEESRMPSLDVVLDNFSIHGRYWGQLILTGFREGALWHIQHLELSRDSGHLVAEGRWLAQPQLETQLNFKLDSSDLGKLFADSGYPHLVARGRGTMQGQVHWRGNPEDFTWARLSGMLDLQLHDGQFSKIEPGGAGRLIGLLSLQSLPRRVTLDFHDIFSDGFAFDTLSSKAEMDRGMMTLHHFDMTGPAARVGLTGTIDLARETSDLLARVDPAVGGSLSLATTLVGGPVAGAATYLVQKLLKNPLDSALSHEYRIEGSWDDPQIKPSRRGDEGAP